MTLVPQLYSPPPAMQQLDSDSSPVFLRRSSLTSSLHDDEDDGFMEVPDDSVEVCGPCPVVSRLIGSFLTTCPPPSPPAGRRLDADGDGEPAHSSAGGRRLSRGLCELRSSCPFALNVRTVQNDRRVSPPSP